MMALIIALLALLGFSQGDADRWQQLDAWMQPNGKVKVLSTTAMIDDVVRQVGGEAIDSVVLIVGDMDPHSYEIVKGDAEKFDFADLVFANGLGLEHGASLRYRLQKHRHVVDLGSHLPKASVVKIDGMIDPHFWTDIELFALTVQPIVDELSRLRPELAEVFAERGAAVYEKLMSTHKELLEAVGALPDEKRYLVTSHDAFHYFARKYFGGEDRFAAPEGLAPEGQMCAADIREIIDFLKEHNTKVVFPESNLPRGALKKIQDAYPDVIVADTVLYGDAMGEKGSGADDYVGMMRHNVKQICEYLAQ